MTCSVRHAITASARTVYVSLIILAFFLKDGWAMAEVSLFLEFALHLWIEARTIAIDTARIHLNIMLLTL